MTEQFTFDWIPLSRGPLDGDHHTETDVVASWSSTRCSGGRCGSSLKPYAIGKTAGGAAALSGGSIQLPPRAHIRVKRASIGILKGSNVSLSFGDVL